MYDKLHEQKKKKKNNNNNNIYTLIQFSIYLVTKLFTYSD